jgi:hypothetical protein
MESNNIIYLLITFCFLFCVTSTELYFEETFDHDDVFASGKWQTSVQPLYVSQPLKVKASVSAPESHRHDMGIQLTQEMKHYGFGAKLNSPVSISPRQSLVLQYEVKFEEGLTCGGAYVKLLRRTSPDHDVMLPQLDTDTPYSVMFGPDRCGAVNKIHLIIQHFNPVSNQWEEKHFNETIPVHGDKNTHLYSFAIHGNNDFEIRVDNKIAKSGL